MTSISIRLSDELLARVDAARGDPDEGGLTRSQFVRRAVVKALPAKRGLPDMREKIASDPDIPVEAGPELNDWGRYPL